MLNEPYEMVEITAPARGKFFSHGDIAAEFPIKLDDGREMTAIGFRKQLPLGLFQSPALIKDLKITVVHYPGTEDNPEGSYKFVDWPHQTDEFKEQIKMRLVSITSEGFLELLDWKEADPNLLITNSVKANLEKIYHNNPGSKETNSKKLSEKLVYKNSEITDNNSLGNILYRGGTFSIQELAKHLGIRLEVLINRIKKGWPEDRWDEKNSKLSHYFYNGKRFESISALADHLGVRPAVLRNRINKGLPQSEWGKPRFNKEIIYLGQSFPSIAALAKHLNINPQTLRGRIQRGWPQEKWGL